MPGFPDRAPVDEGRRSVRFNPDTGALEALAGRSQYGEAFDPWGRYFGSNNSNHIRMEMLAARYLQRNPDAPLSWGMRASRCACVSGGGACLAPSTPVINPAASTSAVTIRRIQISTREVRRRRARRPALLSQLRT